MNNKPIHYLIEIIAYVFDFPKEYKPCIYPITRAQEQELPLDEPLPKESRLEEKVK